MGNSYIEKNLGDIKRQEELIDAVISQKEYELTRKALEQIKEYLDAQIPENYERLSAARTKYYTYIDAIAIVTGKNESDIHEELLEKAAKEREHDN